jgi:hypothetical protein
VLISLWGGGGRRSSIICALSSHVTLSITEKPQAMFSLLYSNDTHSGGQMQILDLSVRWGWLHSFLSTLDEFGDHRPGLWTRAWDAGSHLLAPRGLFWTGLHLFPRHGSGSHLPWPLVDLGRVWGSRSQVSGERPVALSLNPLQHWTWSRPRIGPLDTFSDLIWQRVTSILFFNSKF